MKKILFLMVIILLFSNIAVADDYLVDIIPTCKGFVRARMYYDKPYNFVDCNLAEDGFYECPCTKNKKIFLNTTIEKRTKVVLEYYLNQYKNDKYRYTKEFFIEPSIEDEKTINYQIKMEKQKLILIILSVLSIVLILLFLFIYLIRKWYIKVLSED
jgi:hypothetical protein